MLYGKNVLLGVCGGIAAYKSCEIVSRLKKLGASVDVVMTENATRFVTPLTFSSLAGSRTVCDAFEGGFEYDVKHVSLAKKADVFIIAPATANVIAKLACGIADDMLTTVAVATRAPLLICPAMNTGMWESVTVKENIAVLRQRGALIVEPDSGRLACGDTGKGKMASPEQIVDEAVKLLMPVNDYDGKRVLVTAGATKENIDGVRCITNNSSGKMGMAIARAAADRGARVTVIKGIVSVPVPENVYKVVDVSSTEQMYDAVMAELADNDIVIKAAAPADYRPAEVYDNKIKSQTLTLEFVKNPDIAAAVGKIKGDKKLVVFSAETQNLLSNARAKLESKNADMVVANDLTAEGAGFNVDTNIATIIAKDGIVCETGLVTKRRLADIILDTVKTL